MIIIHKNKSTKDLPQIWLRTISIVEILGGALGIFNFPHMVKGITNITYFILYTLVYLPPFILCFIAGIFLVCNSRNGIYLSMIIQGLQVIYLTAGKLTYKFISFLFLGIFIEWPRIGFEYRITSNLEIPIVSYNMTFSLGVNIVALLFFYHLFRYNMALNKQKEKFIKELVTRELVAAKELM